MHHLQYPSVLRLIALTIQAGNRARIPVAMCGEMAGDPRYTRLLLGFGLDEFSMHPATLLQVKQIVRGSRHALLRKFAGRVLQAIKVSGTIIAANFTHSSNKGVRNHYRCQLHSFGVARVDVMWTPTPTD